MTKANEEATDEQTPRGQEPVAGARKPYTRPKLVWLGAVAELTRGVGGSATDGSLGLSRGSSRPIPARRR